MSAAQKNRFFSGQAIQETSFSAADLVTNRNGPLNRTKAKIGDVTATEENTGIMANYLCGYFKSASPGVRAPVVFDSLTGLAFDKGKDTKWSYMDKIVLAGRTQTAINTSGVVGGETAISVQVGGLGSIRYFTEKQGEFVSWGDRLAWTIPNLDVPEEEKKTYKWLNQLARDEFKRQKVPFLVKKIDVESYYEFPRVAMAYFIEKTMENIKYYRLATTQQSRDPRDVWIQTNAVPVAKLAAAMVANVHDVAKYHIESGEILNDSFISEPKDAIILSSLMFIFSGLIPNVHLKNIVEKGGELTDTTRYHFKLWDYFTTARPYKERSVVLSVANKMLAGQYDCWSHLQSHFFGTAMDVGVPGSALKVLFRL